MPEVSRSAALAVALSLCCALSAQRPHPHRHGTTHDPGRFTTNRTSQIRLPLPEEKDAFFFVIFGDRTGGPPEGVEILARAVDEVNLLEPDLVMTVGDLVEGYNTTGKWLEQMREYKGIMNRLLMPWFPVAGNHDVYWRGPGKPPGEHEGDYETHFGPLWYAFRHKRCWFVVLYSDEGNPETGVKSTRAPASQRMSPEQFEWLRATLNKTAGAEHVFVFLHHPRWIGRGYGDDWERVHKLLARAGNVSAVFAGHIHRMRYDGPRDGIEYITLATTGGSQRGDVPKAGFLHHYDIVTVRKDQIALATFPVGSAFDPRKVTEQVSSDVRELTESLRPRFAGQVAFDREGAVAGQLEILVENPVTRPVDVTLTFESSDPFWVFRPDHMHTVIAPGGHATFAFGVGRRSSLRTGVPLLPQVTLSSDYLGDGLRVPLPDRTANVPVVAGKLPPPEQPKTERVLVFDGERDCLRVEHARLELPDGPLTVEGWLRADRFRERQGFVNKTELSEFGIFLSRGVPSFMVHIGNSYVSASDQDSVLKTKTWHHVAGVFDGEEVRLYIDGALVASSEGRGERTVNDLPLVVGADVGPGGEGNSHFTGRIDEVRISRTARYRGAQFRPSRRFKRDSRTILLLHMDGEFGLWMYDSSRAQAHALLVGTPELAGPEISRR